MSGILMRNLKSSTMHNSNSSCVNKGLIS